MSNGAWTFGKESVSHLIGEYEKEGLAYRIPKRDMIERLRKEVENGSHILLNYDERFKAADISEPKTGEALRILSTQRELIRRALMWLQREYLETKFNNFDPTSNRDEDLPVDRDHLIPHSLFKFDWYNPEKRLEKDCITENFRWRRELIGNSLGNFRWLAARDNRSRQNNRLESEPEYFDQIEKPNDWNELIGKEKWGVDKIQKFQSLIDLRTLSLYETLLKQSGIEDILPPIADRSS